MVKPLLVLTHFLILGGYIVGSGLWVTTGSAYYRSLQVPPWQPPDAVFGLAWTYNFAMLAVVGVLAVRVAPGWWLGCFASSVVAALAWANLFYIQQNPWAAAAALTVAAVLTIPMVAVAFGVGRWVGIAMLPYLLWLCVATSLAYGYAALNTTR